MTERTPDQTIAVTSSEVSTLLTIPSKRAGQVRWVPAPGTPSARCTLRVRLFNVDETALPSEPGHVHLDPASGTTYFGWGGSGDIDSAKAAIIHKATGGTGTLYVWST